jgi:hypothetical protein
MADEARPQPTADLLLTCRPGKAGNLLRFPYRLENRGPTGIYAMHAWPGIDPATGEARAKEQTGVAILGTGGNVTLAACRT